MENNGINRIDTTQFYPHITPKRYPIGDLSFTDIRETGRIYVDITEVDRIRYPRRLGYSGT